MYVCMYVYMYVEIEITMNEEIKYYDYRIFCSFECSVSNKYVCMYVCMKK